MGVEAGEARRVITTAEQLESLPAVDAAVRAGELSTREAELIAEAASHNPAAEAKLLDAATRPPPPRTTPHRTHRRRPRMRPPPGGHNRGYLELDHTHNFAKGGLTSWHNLKWLCYLHHKRKTARTTKPDTS